MPAKRKPGRPKEYEKARVSSAIRFDPVLHAKLKKAAKERDVPMNFLVNLAVEEFLERLIPIEEFRWTRD